MRGRDDPDGTLIRFFLLMKADSVVSESFLSVMGLVTNEFPCSNAPIRCADASEEDRLGVFRFQRRRLSDSPPAERDGSMKKSVS
jgi:hypothetical protein